MADFDEKIVGSQRSGPVRPSMVVMTSKILKTTESIAAMNLRIAGGVFLCVLLITATFVVNVLAFDYAKESKMSGVMLVSADTGNAVSTLTKTEFHPNYQPLESQTFLSKDGAMVFSNGNYGKYTFQSQEILDCPDGYAASEFCHDGKTYLSYSSNGRALYAFPTSDNTKFEFSLVGDADFLTKLSIAPLVTDQSESGKQRRLLCADPDSQMDCWVGGGNCNWRTFSCVY